MRVVLLVALLAAAGCLDQAGGQAEDVRPHTLPWGLSDCSYVIAVMPVPSDRLQPLLPEGFTPLPSRNGLPGDGELHADAYHCAGGVGLDGRPLADVQYGSFYVPVEAPDELREEGYGAYFVKLDFIAPDGEHTDILAEAGLPAHSGRASATQTGATLWSAELAMETAGGFTFEGISGPATAQDGPLPFIEHSPLTSGGLALWHARLHHASFSTGVGALLLNGPMVDVVGSNVVAVTFSAGAWNLDEADVTFPVAWP